MREYYYLQREDVGTIYFKSKERTGHTFTSSLSEAKRFNSKSEAIDCNHEWLYGACKVVRY